MDFRSVLDFWFEAANRRCWFRSTPAFDRLIRERFEAVWKVARDGQLDTWEDSPEGALALVVVLDQFPLNMYRGTALSYSTEAQSREVARRALAAGFDVRLNDEQRAFLYLPFMHSENLSDQDRAVELFERAGLEDNLRWARHHRDIVRRFGRFPHRNALLQRENTPEESRWLQSDQAFSG